MARKPNGATLPGLPDSGPKRGGTVYRGVCLQINTVVGGDDDAMDERAGLIAQARTLAHTIDCASGWGGSKVETYALPQLHRELRELLAAIAGTTEVGDAEALAALLAAGDDPETGA